MRSNICNSQYFHFMKLMLELIVSNGAVLKLTQLNSTQLTTPKEKSGLQEERSYKSLYKSPILQ